jgi:copper homeostasis protein
MPGGGVTWRNAEDIGSELGVREVHGTRIVRLQT